MPINKTVFGSESERELYHSLESRWSKRFRVFPSLPYLQIISIKSNSISSLSSRELAFIKKASVDYTLCTKRGKAILSIEFDGMCHGYSKNGKYIQVLRSNDPLRKKKLELKIQIAEKENYPFFVVSYDEKNPIGEKTNLTIVDGIIGQVLAGYAIDKKIKEWIKENPGNKNELVTIEVEKEMKYDPIKNLQVKLKHLAYTKGGMRTYSIQKPQDPMATDITTAKRIGCKIIIEPDISETVWIRNFENKYVSNPFTIVENIAKLLAFEKFLGKKGIDFNLETL